VRWPLTCALLYHNRADAFIFVEAMWTLQSVDPEDAGLTFRMLPGTLKTLGRAPRADFVVDAALVSRVHCRFTLNDAGQLELEDLGSTNGTFVNGRKVTKLLLSDGDKLTIGRMEFVVNSAGSQQAGNPKTSWTS
jgi:hypothetical protein